MLKPETTQKFRIPVFSGAEPRATSAQISTNPARLIFKPDPPAGTS